MTAQDLVCTTGSRQPKPPPRNDCAIAVEPLVPFDHTTLNANMQFKHVFSLYPSLHRCWHHVVQNLSFTPKLFTARVSRIFRTFEQNLDVQKLSSQILCKSTSHSTVRCIRVGAFIFEAIAWSVCVCAFVCVLACFYLALHICINPTNCHSQFLISLFFCRNASGLPDDVENY